MDMLVEWDGSAALTTGIDTAHRAVRITPAGTWTIADVDRFHALQKRINDAARARYGALKIVMDLRGAQVVTAEVSAQMQAGSYKIYGPHDQIAVITSSALLRMQLQRAFTIGIVRIFTSQAEAEAWLAGRGEIDARVA